MKRPRPTQGCTADDDDADDDDNDDMTTVEKTIFFMLQLILSVLCGIVKMRKYKETRYLGHKHLFSVSLN
jgi:hypothetical protein